MLDDGGFVDAFTRRSFADVIPDIAKCSVVAVDMPIGLLDVGVRECEQLARAALGSRAGTVFPMPPRSVLEAGSHAEALARCRELGTPGVSAQGYALRGKVLELETAVARASMPVFEVHPELSFLTMAGGTALPNKRTWDGLWRRVELLRAHGIELPPALPDTTGAAPDDVVDAAACAWTARRYVTGAAVSLPDPPQRGPRGEAIAIWH